MCGGDDDKYTQKDKDEAADPKNKSDEVQKNGPLVDRSCTDVLCCLLFFVFFLGLFATAAYGYKNGDPYRLLTPFDASGNQCGIGNFTEFPYLWWPDLPGSSFDIDKTACVTGCPTAKDETVVCRANRQVTTCPDTADYVTKLYLDRFCLPNPEEYKEYAQKIIQSVTGEKVAKYVGDIAKAWQVILGLGIGSAVLALIYLFLLRWVAKPLLYISFLLIFALLLVLGVFLWIKKDDYEEGDNT